MPLLPVHNDARLRGRLRLGRSPADRLRLTLVFAAVGRGHGSAAAIALEEGKPMMREFSAELLDSAAAQMARWWADVAAQCLARGDEEGGGRAATNAAHFGRQALAEVDEGA